MGGSAPLKLKKKTCHEQQTNGQKTVFCKIAIKNMINGSDVLFLNNHFNFRKK